MVQVPTGETKPEGGGGIDAECDCHLVIEGYEDFSADNSPRLVFDFGVLASTDPAQVGKKRKGEAFTLSAKAAGRLLELACAVGLYTKQQWKADKEAGIDPDINYADSIGRQLCAPVHMKPFDDAYWKKRLEAGQKAGDEKEIVKCQEQIEKYSGKAFAQIGGKTGFAFWALGDKEADHVPLDPESISMFENGLLPTKTGEFRKRGQAGQAPAGQVATGAAGATGTKAAPPASKPAPAAKPQQQQTQQQAAPAQPAAAGAGTGGGLW